VYFLTGLRNPTRTIFDFFDEPEGRTARILGALDARGVNVVVINHDEALSFSAQPAADLRAGLEARYPHGRAVGQFEVRWRE
jgi:hypothetical protein